jgi:hypothetical protein
MSKPRVQAVGYVVPEILGALYSIVYSAAGPSDSVLFLRCEHDRSNLAATREVGSREGFHALPVLPI